MTDNEGTTPSDTITLDATDSLDNSANEKTIVVTTNGLPVITAPNAITLNQDQTTPIPDVSLSESGDTSKETFTVSLADANGLLSTDGYGPTTSLTITGSLAEVNDELATLADSDPTPSSDTITINASDSLGSQASPQSIAVTVNTTALPEFLASYGDLTQTGNDYDLDLGDVAEGSGALSTVILVLNADAPPADDLSGDFSISGDSEFTNSGFADFSGLAPGAFDYAGAVTLADTSMPGDFTDTITLNPAASLITGSQIQLDRLTLTVEVTVTRPQPGSLNPDPHLITFDGLHYDFQTAGEFVLVKDTNGGTFQVQARLAAPVRASSYSVITEIGIQVGGDVVTIDATRPAPVWVDGQAITLTGSKYGLANGLITKTATGYVVALNTGEEVTANFSPGAMQSGPVTTSTGGISVSVSLAPNTPHDSVEGLLGDYNGNPMDDLTLADGTVEPTNMPTSVLYGVYADSWRVTQATSLLDYGPGQTTATFTDTNYPGTPISVASFPAQAVAAATQVVQQAGITDPGLQQEAIYDYLVTGDPSVITVEANLQQEGVTTVAQADFVSPPPPPEVGILAFGTSQVEAASGPTTVTFDVYMTGDTSQPVTVGYTVVAPDATYLGASDFGGTLPAGTITLAAGQTSSNLSISLPGSIGAAVSKTLEVQISAATPATVIGPTARETIFNSAPVAGVAPLFGVEFVNDPTLLPTQNGTSWTFDLGALSQGGVFNPGMSLAVLNLAGIGADDLAAAISETADVGLPTRLTSPTFANLAPGGMLDIADIAVATTSPGPHSETFTFTPEDTNITGYAAALPTETVTVTDTVYPLAQAQLSTNAIDFGAARAGSAPQQAIAITNNGAIGAENLDAVVGALTGAASGSGSFGLLPVGQTSSAIVVGLTTSTAGPASGTVTLDLSSDGTGIDGLGSTPLPPQTVTVSGTVYLEAAASIAPISEIVHVNSPGTAALTVSNTDPADGYSENLIAAMTGTTGGIGIAAAGPTGEIAAMANDSTLAVSFSTATAATVSGTATMALTSDGGTGAGSIDGLGQTALAPQNVPVSITVDNYAVAALAETAGGGTFTQNANNSQGGNDYTIDLGSLAQGSTPVTVDLAALNAAMGPADALSGTFQISGSSAFTNALSSFSNLAAGDSDPAGTVALSTAVAGSFTETVTLSGTGSNASGYSAAVPEATLTIEGTITAPAGQTFNLTKNPDTVQGGPGNDLVIAASNTLSAGDQIDGGGGTNTLALEGAGTFNLTRPTTLANVEIIAAQEGQAAYNGGGQTFVAQNQIVTLRDGLNATVDVSPATSVNPNNPKPPTITIVGANNADVINLASGNDVVTVGSTAETVNLGSGNDTIMVSSTTIGATIGDGTGQNTLDITGGTMAMGSSISDIANVLLSPAAGGYSFTANALSGLTVDDTGTATADTLIAGGGNQTLTGGGAGKETFTGSAAGGDTFKDSAALFNGDSVIGFGNNGDTIDLTNVNFATLQPLAYTQNNTNSGTLTVSDGTHMAAITLFGQFIASEFHPASDGGTGTTITDPLPPLQTALATPLHH